MATIFTRTADETRVLMHELKNEGYTRRLWLGIVNGKDAGVEFFSTYACPSCGFPVRGPNSVVVIGPMVNVYSPQFFYPGIGISECVSIESDGKEICSSCETVTGLMPIAKNS